MTASLSDPSHGEDSPRPRTDHEDAVPTCLDGGGVSSKEPDWKDRSGSVEFSLERAPVAGDTGGASATATAPAVGAPSEAGEACASGGGEGDDTEPQEELSEACASGEGGDDGSGACKVETCVEAVKGEGGECDPEVEVEEEEEEEGGGGSGQGDAGDDGTGTEGLSSDDVAGDEMEEQRPVEDILAELSVSGQKALEGSDTSSPGAPPAFGEHLLPVSGGSPSIAGSNIIRSLFSDDDGQGERGGGEGGEEEEEEEQEEEEEEAQREMGNEEKGQVGGGYVIHLGGGVVHPRAGVVICLSQGLCYLCIPGGVLSIYPRGYVIYISQGVCYLYIPGGMLSISGGVLTIPGRVLSSVYPRGCVTLRLIFRYGARVPNYKAVYGSLVFIFLYKRSCIWWDRVVPPYHDQCTSRVNATAVRPHVQPCSQFGRINVTFFVLFSHSLTAPRNCSVAATALTYRAVATRDSVSENTFSPSR